MQIFSKIKEKLHLSKKTLAVVLGILVFLGISSYFAFVKPALNTLAAAKKLQTHVRPLKDSLLLQDLVMAENQLREAQDDLEKVETALQPLSWTKIIPFFGNYYRDAEHFLAAGEYSTEAGLKMVAVVEPVADVLGFKTEGSEASFGTAGERLPGVLEALPEISSGLDTVEPELLNIQQELGKVEPDRYPKFVRVQGMSVREGISQVKKVTDQLDSTIPQVKEVLAVLPQVMGQDEKKTYVVLFQNDKELRPTGGFWTAYALLEIDNGEIRSKGSEDMYYLDRRIASKPPAPALYQRFLKIDQYFIRDANLSPDFPTAARQFYSFWNRAEGTESVDGILAVDTYFVSNLLEILGPVEVSGYSEPFTSENVVMELEKYATLLRKDQWGRKALLGDLMEEMLKELLSAPKEKWQPLLEEFVALGAEKHLLLYLFDSEVQEVVAKHNWHGGISTSFTGDYLHVNEANLAGAKANLYVTREVTQKLEKDGDSWAKTVTVDFENPEPYDGWLNGPYRAYVRLLVPEGAELISIEGGQAAVPRESYYDVAVDKQIFAAFNITRPLESSQLVFKYTLPQEVVGEESYNLLVQKQPGIEAPPYTVIVEKNKESFELDKDRELELPFE